MVSFALPGVRRNLGLLAAAACAVVVAACGGSELLAQDFEAIVRQRAAVEFACAEGVILVTDLGGLAFRADGCGGHATYECVEEHVSGRVYGACVRAVRDDPTPDDAAHE